MNMEVVDETIGCNDQFTIIKGRRTKRQRPSSPFSLVSSSSVDAGSSAGGGGSSSSHMNSGENTEEEEDMANCLILLAQGHNKKQTKRMDVDGVIESQKMVEATSITRKEDGLYVYQCKTCNRCFSSFQALGGHRASHKKPKAMEEKKAILTYEENERQFNNTSSSPNHQSLPLLQHMGSSITNNKSKVHECSICGAEFSSGQALGGHMRRHRTPTTTAMVMSHIATESQEKKGSRNNLLALDLNLPAPEEEHEKKFMFTSNQPPLIFSASSLVDCHY